MSDYDEMIFTSESLDYLHGMIHSFAVSMQDIACDIAIEDNRVLVNMDDMDQAYGEIIKGTGN